MKISFTGSEMTKHKSWSIYLKRYLHIYGFIQRLTLDQVLRDPSIDDATHARLLKYIIRLARKSGRLPRQLLLDVEPHQMVAVGNGGSATIYRASYKNKIVAVKRSHLPRVAQCRKVSSL